MCARPPEEDGDDGERHLDPFGHTSGAGTLAINEGDFVSVT